MVDDDLSIPGRPGGWAIGDVAHIVPATGDVRRTRRPAARAGRDAGRRDGRPPTSRHAIAGEPTEPFRYRNKGTMATIGRRSAVTEIPRLPPLVGSVAWLAWLVLHLWMLIGFRNRVSVLVNWAWNYLTWDRGPADHPAQRSRRPTGRTLIRVVAWPTLRPSDPPSTRYCATFTDDRDGWLALFADDATVEDPIGSDVNVGKDAIGAFWDMTHGLADRVTLTPSGYVKVVGNEAAFAMDARMYAGDGVERHGHHRRHDLRRRRPHHVAAGLLGLRRPRPRRRTSRPSGPAEDPVDRDLDDGPVVALLRLAVALAVAALGVAAAFGVGGDRRRALEAQPPATVDLAHHGPRCRATRPRCGPSSTNPR